MVYIIYFGYLTESAGERAPLRNNSRRIYTYVMNNIHGDWTVSVLYIIMRPPHCIRKPFIIITIIMSVKKLNV